MTGDRTPGARIKQSLPKAVDRSAGSNPRQGGPTPEHRTGTIGTKNKSGARGTNNSLREGETLTPPSMNGASALKHKAAAAPKNSDSGRGGR